MSLEAQIADLNLTLKRIATALEHNIESGNAPKIQTLDLSGQLEDKVEEEPVETEEAAEEQAPAKRKRKKKASKKVEKEEVADEEESEPEEPQAEVVDRKSISPLLRQLTEKYASERHDDDQSLGKKDVLDFMEDATGVRKLQQIADEQLSSFKLALEEELA